MTTTTSTTKKGSEEEEIVAFARWSFSPARKEGEKVEDYAEKIKKGEMKLPHGGDEEMFMEVIGLVSEKRERIMGGRGHWCMLLPCPPCFFICL